MAPTPALPPAQAAAPVTKSACERALDGAVALLLLGALDGMPLARADPVFHWSMLIAVLNACNTSR